MEGNRHCQDIQTFLMQHVCPCYSFTVCKRVKERNPEPYLTGYEFKGMFVITAPTAGSQNAEDERITNSDLCSAYQGTMPCDHSAVECDVHALLKGSGKVY